MADESPTPRTTRRAWQALAEHVLAAALHAATGRIGLRRTPGGFGTPVFEHEGERRQIVVDGTDLEVRDGDRTRRTPITTLRSAGELVGIEPGAPVDVYTPTTVLDLDAPLLIDAEQAHILADWFELVDEALERLRLDASEGTDGGEEPAIVQLWPEHFDLATTIGEVNYGGSPGDDEHERPYLYVGPWAPPPVDDFWNEPFGVSRSADQVASVADAVAFLRDGRDRIR